jgi:ribosomal-protein-alanine N-acetyltransferase
MIHVALTSMAQLDLAYTLLGMQNDVVVSKELLAQQIDRGNVYSIMLEKLMVGLIRSRIILDEAELDQIIVHSDYQNLGVGYESLLSWIQHLNSKHSVRKIFLEVRENNVHAIRLYKKLGFIKIAKRKNYYTIGTESFHADVMALSI